MRKLRAALRWLFDLGRWRVVCPDCKGTGVCQHATSRWLHSCGRKLVPRSQVPAGFDGPHWKTITTAVIGTGWVWGSFWQGLQWGFYHG